jgi:hypothetical protein
MEACGPTCEHASVAPVPIHLGGLVEREALAVHKIMSEQECKKRVYFGKSVTLFTYTIGHAAAVGSPLGRSHKRRTVPGALFDHLVDLRKQEWRKRQPQRLRGLPVDRHLKFRADSAQICT